MLGLILSTTHLDDESSVIAVHGELDPHTTPRLEHTIAEAFDGGAKAVTVNLTACEFLDSSALKMLLRAKRQRGHVSLVITDRRILKPFEITRFDRFFPIHSTVEEASSKATRA